MSRSYRMLTFVACLLLAACSRGPGQKQLESDLQARLDEQFGRQVLEIDRLRRQGSSPLRPGSDGAKRALVYYNAVLQFTEDYDASDWGTLSPAVISQSLGATEQGVAGLSICGYYRCS